MVRLGLLAVLAACGRLGFEETPVPDVDAAEESRSFRSLCEFAKLTVIENDLPIDDLAGQRAGDAVAAGCGTTPSRRTVSQDAPGVLDPVSDRPLLPADDLGVIGGGDGPHRAVAYLLRNDTPLVWSGGGASAEIRERATGRLIAGGGVDGDHDYAFIMVVNEPIGGSRILSAQGFTAAGTTVASAWFEAEVAPMITSNLDAWLVVEWSDTDAVAGPTASDTYVVVASGR